MYLMRSPGRREGTPLEVTDKFREDARLALAARGWNQSDLARKLEVSPGLISRIFGGEGNVIASRGVKSSTFVAPIADLLEIPKPGSIDPLVREAADAMNSLRLLNPSAFSRELIHVRHLLDAEKKQLARGFRKRSRR